MVFPLDTEIDLLRSVHSLTPGTDFLRTSSSGGGGGGGAVTPTGFATPVSGSPTQVSVSSTTTTLFAPNATRAYAHIFNNSGETIYIQFSANAVLMQGIRLGPGTFFTISGYELWLGQINAICSSTALIDTFESGY